MKIPKQLTLDEVQSAFRSVQTELEPLTRYNIVMNGRRIIEAGRSIHPSDYVTQQEIKELESMFRGRMDKEIDSLPGALNKDRLFRIGPFTARGSAVAHDGEIFVTSDRNFISFASDAGAWNYHAGIHRDTYINRPTIANADATGYLFFATNHNHIWRSDGTNWILQEGFTEPMRGTLSPDQKPTGFGTNDAGFLFYSTDFDHTYRWSGTAWVLISGEPPGMIGAFDIAPGTGWQVCDGTATTRSTTAGGTTAVTVPNYATAAYLKLISAAHTVGPTAASGLTTNVSAGTPAGTVSQPTFTGNAVAAASTNATPDLVAPDVTAAGVSPVTTATGTVSQPTFSGTALAGHEHAANTLELRRTELLAYYRL